jgi:hypothetical protein
MAKLWNEDEPTGVQRNFFHIAPFELAWRGGEAVTPTEWFEYKPIFTKSTQGGGKKLCDTNVLPVRLLAKMLEKRSDTT